MTATENYQSTFSPDDTFSVPDTAARVTEGSPLEALRTALKEKVRNPDLTLRVPTRERIRLIFDTNIDGDEFQAWQKRAMPRRSTNVANMDTVKLSAVVIANQCKGVMVATGEDTWREAFGTDGTPLNFRHSEFREMIVGDEPLASVASQGVELVRRFYGNDGALLQTAREVLEAAGYAEEDDELSTDPTRG